MELKSLMSGIAVVIDDALKNVTTDEDGTDGSGDLIFEIVERLKREWNLPFYTANEIPLEETWPNLLQAASFVLLDWRLWPSGASELEQAGVKKNNRFLEQAKNYLVPVFIFTNENPEDVENELSEAVYQKKSAENSFVFIRGKDSLLSGDSLDFSAIEEWISKNPSVYALKTWEQAFYVAKKELFSSMYARSPNWPMVFWKTYKADSVDPSSSLTHLINDSLQGRMRTNAFEDEILAAPPGKIRIPGTDLRGLIGETSFAPSENDIRCGDLFELSKKKFLLNLRPDCDCVPRDGQGIDEVELYCVEGKVMRDNELRKEYKNGHFDERVWGSVAFAAYQGKSVRFDFRNLYLKRFQDIKEWRVGRLLHPYLTRIQQRYALYLQRQGLPRIPEEAVSCPGNSR